MSQQDYKRDRKWGDSYESQVRSILMRLLPHLAEIALAPVEMDNKQATDFTMTLKGGSIAVRLRRPFYDQRDLTIRSHRDSNVKTELAKIKEGHAFRYFYGWTDELKRIAEWILVDLDRLRLSGLLERRWQQIPNKDRNGKPDGTHFIAIPVKSLSDAGCLLANQLKFVPTPPRQVNLSASIEEGIQRASKVKCYSPRVEQSSLFGGDYV